MNDEPLTIVKDTREPREAWDCYFTAPVIVQKLDVGDYSAVGYERMISIERKELNDLVNCLGKQRDRFEDELRRAQQLEFFCVIIEAPYSKLAGGDYMSRLNPRRATESLSAFEVRYSTFFLFAGSPRLAALKCQSLLSKFHREEMKALELIRSRAPF